MLRLVLMIPAFLLASAFAELSPAPSLQPSSQGFRDCPDCPELVRVLLPAAASGQSASSLFVGRYEVTWHQYLKAVREAGCAMPRGAGNLLLDIADLSLVDDDVAVSGVSIADVECYLGWLSRKAGKAYRLPTGAEWEFAARGGAETRFPWGEELGVNRAFVKSGFDQQRFPRKESGFGPRKTGGSRSVGQLPPNTYELHDVIGNVAELTSDFTSHQGPKGCAQQRPSCRLFEIRGGSYIDDGQVDVTTRRYLNEAIGDVAVGFRVVRD